MNTRRSELWESDTAQRLAAILTAVHDEASMRAFLGDILTQREIIEISARLEAARMLRAGATYTDITARTKLSSRTIARIKDWIINGYGGYGAALAQIECDQPAL